MVFSTSLVLISTGCFFFCERSNGAVVGLVLRKPSGQGCSCLTDVIIYFFCLIRNSSLTGICVQKSFLKFFFTPASPLNNYERFHQTSHLNLSPKLLITLAYITLVICRCNTITYAQTYAYHTHTHTEDYSMSMILIRYVQRRVYYHSGAPLSSGRVRLSCSSAVVDRDGTKKNNTFRQCSLGDSCPMLHHLIERNRCSPPRPALPTVCGSSGNFLSLAQVYAPGFPT